MMLVLNRAAAVMLVGVAGCSGILDPDERPSTWTESTAADVYFAAPLIPNTYVASVVFATAPLDRQRLPIDFGIRVATWVAEGSTIYDGTLEYLSLTAPVEGEDRWWWTGSAPDLWPNVNPGFVGVQIRGMPYAARRSQPLVHRFCLIDVIAAGVHDCDLWSQAIFRKLVICRGIVGNVIDCEGVGFEIVPVILVSAVARAGQAGDDMANETAYLMIPGAGTVFREHDGRWSYAPESSAERHGPFSDTVSAASDIVELVDPEVARWLSAMPSQVMPAAFAPLLEAVRALVRGGGG